MMSLTPYILLLIETFLHDLLSENTFKSIDID